MTGSGNMIDGQPAQITVLSNGQRCSTRLPCVVLSLWKLTHPYGLTRFFLIFNCMLFTFVAACLFCSFLVVQIKKLFTQNSDHGVPNHHLLALLDNCEGNPPITDRFPHRETIAYHDVKIILATASDMHITNIYTTLLEITWRIVWSHLIIRV